MKIKFFPILVLFTLSTYCSLAVESIAKKDKSSVSVTERDSVGQIKDVIEDDNASSVPKDITSDKKQKAENASIFSEAIQTMIDTTPLRLLPVNIRNQLIPLKHHFGDYVLTRRQNGTYYLQNDTVIIRESYPNILLHIGKDFGRLESKIEYYDSNQVLLRSVDLRKNILLAPEHLKKLTFGLHGGGEFLSVASPYIVPDNYKDIADSLLVDIEVSLEHASPFRVIDYSIKGLDKDQLIIGFENIVVVLDEKGETIFKELFDKTISGSFIDERGKFLCLGFSNPNYANPKSKLGDLVIKDLEAGKTLLNYIAKSSEIESVSGFQEIKRDLWFLSLGPKAVKRTNQIYVIRGLIDFKSRKFYKVIRSKEELEKRKKENLYHFKNIDLSEWTLIGEF